MDEREPSIDPAALRAWKAPLPPSDFVDRVMKTHGRNEPEKSEPPRWGRVALAVGLVAALVVVSFVLHRVSDPHVRGTLVADGRRTVKMGGRATVVAERGASLSWDVADDGDASVRQSRGRAFYRVDEGGSFEVWTPAGRVRVTGTCFSVEVESMNNAVKGALMGAAVAVGVTVTVYEGSVVLADDSGTVEVKAGQRAATDAAGSPRLLSDPEDEASDEVQEAPDGDIEAGLTPVALRSQVRRQAEALERMRASNRDQRDLIENLKHQIEELGGKPVEEAGGVVQAERCAHAGRNEPGCSFVDPSPETLSEMAKCGAVRVDTPSFLYEPELPSSFGDDWSSQAGLGPQEQEAVEASADAFRERHVAKLRELYVEAGGEPELAQDVSAAALLGLLSSMFGPDEVAEVHRRISRERAGLESPPADQAALPLTERYVRTVIGAGNELERAIADAVGPERAAALRRLGDGWPGGTSTYSHDCE